jgi:hypothetical protein
MQSVRRLVDFGRWSLIAVKGVGLAAGLGLLARGGASTLEATQALSLGVKVDLAKRRLE